MFAADFEEMKVKELKDELMVRGASRTGVEGVLQQMLHTLIVKAAAEVRRGHGRTRNFESSGVSGFMSYDVRSTGDRGAQTTHSGGWQGLHGGFSVLGDCRLQLLVFSELAKYQLSHTCALLAA
eukprot:1428430-Prymnesium_polylepis.2